MWLAGVWLRAIGAASAEMLQTWGTSRFPMTGTFCSFGEKICNIL